MADPKRLHSVLCVLYCFISTARNTRLDLAVSRTCGNPSLIIMAFGDCRGYESDCWCCLLLQQWHCQAVILGALPAFGQGPGPWGEEHKVGVWIMHLAFTESCVWGVPGLSHICIAKSNMKWPTWYVFRNVLNERHSWNCSTSWIWCILVFIPSVKHCKWNI